MGDKHWFVLHVCQKADRPVQSTTKRTSAKKRFPMYKCHTSACAEGSRAGRSEWSLANSVKMTSGRTWRTLAVTHKTWAGLSHCRMRSSESAWSLTRHRSRANNEVMCWGKETVYRSDRLYCYHGARELNVELPFTTVRLLRYQTPVNSAIKYLSERCIKLERGSLLTSAPA